MKVKDGGEQTEEEKEAENQSGSSGPRGLVMDPYNQGMSIVVHAPSKIKAGGRELQLPSMSQLTSKNSSQQFFLRILKVIIQLRDAAREAARKQRRPESRDISNISEAMAVLEAEAEAIMEMVGRRERLARPLEQLREQAELAQSSSEPAASSESQPAAAEQTTSSSADTETPMDVDQPGQSLRMLMKYPTIGVLGVYK